MIYGVVFMLLLAFDQWLKWWSVSHLTLCNLDPQCMYVVIPKVLDLNLSYNTGAAWSIFPTLTGVLAVLRLLAGLGFLYYVLKHFKRMPAVQNVSLTLIAVGAMGNALDGLRLGKVVDMLYSYQLSWVTLKLYGQHFPIFNIADSCIVSGVILLVITGLFEKKKTA